MNIKTKIKELFSSLTASRKDEVRKKISERFGVSMDTAKNHWIYNGGIPNKHVDEVLEILKEEAQMHVDELIAVLDTI